MAISREKEPPILPQHQNPAIEKSGITIGPPEPFMTVVYENGRGNRIEEKVTLSGFNEAGITKKIEEEIKRLRGRLELIPSQLQEISKRKHGGRLIPKSEQTQRRKQLAKEMGSISDKITYREDMIKELETILTLSNPLEPLQVEVDGPEIRVQKGELLSEEDQEFWRYLREEAPEIYRYIELGQTELFQIIHGVFVYRLNWHQATGKDKEKAGNKFLRFIERITDEQYEQIGEDLRNITQYFTRLNL